MIINQPLINIWDVDAIKTFISELSTYTLKCTGVPEALGKMFLLREIFQVSMDIWED